MATEVAGSSSSTSSTSVVKKCQSCGKNVAGGKRLKDANGKYFCMECGTADLRKRGVTTGSVGKKAKSSKSSGPGLMERLKDMIPSGGGESTANKGRLVMMIVVMAALAAAAYWNMHK